MKAAPLLLVCVAAQARAQTVATTSQIAPAQPATFGSEVPPVRTEDEPQLDVLTFHRSNHLLSGFTRETQVKFQFSLKYDLWPSVSHHTAYLAYTQKSLWDLYDRSAPFRESNYAPELFYAHYHSLVHGEPNPGCGLFAEQLGVEHESNGEAGARSRGWNRLFVDVQGTCSGNPTYGLVGVRLWYPFGVAENPNITRTQGYGELRVGVGIDDDQHYSNGLVTVAVRKGTSRNWGRGSVTVDARWRPTYRRLFGQAWKFAPYLWFQFFGGYGETIGTYDSRSSSARLGIGFTDRAR